MKALKTFYKPVGKSRKAMIDFLQGHFRYDTMSSWNKATSYANKVKIWDVIPSELRDKAFQVMETGDAYDGINMAIDEWARKYDYKWQAGFNGRSGGYLVMYQGGQRPSQHKSYCTKCYQKNFTPIEETGTKCGACGAEARRNYDKPLMETFSYPGKGLDMDRDYSEWDTQALMARVALVQDFDKLCDAVVTEFISLCESYDVEDEEYTVKKTRRVLVEKAEVK